MNFDDNRPKNRDFYLTQQDSDSSKIFYIYEKCDFCDGKGKTYNFSATHICRKCNGTGKSRVPYIRQCNHDPFYCPEGGICEKCEYIERKIDLTEIFIDSDINAGK